MGGLPLRKGAERQRMPVGGCRKARQPMQRYIFFYFQTCRPEISSWKEIYLIYPSKLANNLSENPFGSCTDFKQIGAWREMGSGEKMPVRRVGNYPSGKVIKY